MNPRNVRLTIFGRWSCLSCPCSFTPYARPSSRISTGRCRSSSASGSPRLSRSSFLRWPIGYALDFAENGLAAPTTHVGLLSGNQDEICELAVELGIQTIIEPYVDPARWQAEADISQIASELNEAAKRAARYGLRVGYHNHHFELESKISGVHALEVFADRLAPEVVLEVDTYWAYAGGADVPALLNRLGDRVVALHLKDGDGSLDTSKQVAVGSGVLAGAGTSSKRLPMHCA